LATKTQKVIKLVGLPTPHGKGLDLVVQNKHAGHVQIKQRNINNMLKDELEFKGTKARDTEIVINTFGIDKTKSCVSFAKAA